MKFQILEKADETIHDYLEANFLIKKIIELEKLKTIIFNEDQLTVFNYISKPKIKENEAESQSKLEFALAPSLKYSKDIQLESIPVDKELDKVLEFCSQVLNNEVIDPIDLKLFNLIDKKILQYVEVEQKEEIHKDQTQILNNY